MEKYASPVGPKKSYLDLTFLGINVLSYQLLIFRGCSFVYVLFDTIKLMFKKLLETFSNDTRKQGFRFNWNLIWNKNNFLSFFEPFQAKKRSRTFWQRTYSDVKFNLQWNGTIPKSLWCIVFSEKNKNTFFFFNPQLYFRILTSDRKSFISRNSAWGRICFSIFSLPKTILNIAEQVSFLIHSITQCGAKKKGC